MRECPSVGRSVRRSARRIVNCYFLMLEMEKSLNENHWGRPTLTLLKVLNVLNVLKVLNTPIGPIAQGPITQRPIAQGPIHTRNNQS